MTSSVASYLSLPQAGYLRPPVQTESQPESKPNSNQAAAARRLPTQLLDIIHMHTRLNTKKVIPCLVVPSPPAPPPLPAPAPAPAWGGSCCCCCCCCLRFCELIWQAAREQARHDDEGTSAPARTHTHRARPKLKLFPAKLPDKQRVEWRRSRGRGWEREKGLPVWLRFNAAKSR